MFPEVGGRVHLWTTTNIVFQLLQCKIIKEGSKSNPGKAAFNFIIAVAHQTWPCYAAEKMLDLKTGISCIWVTNSPQDIAHYLPPIWNASGSQRARYRATNVVCEIGWGKDWTAPILQLARNLKMWDLVSQPAPTSLIKSATPPALHFKISTSGKLGAFPLCSETSCFPLRFLFRIH